MKKLSLIRTVSRIREFVRTARISLPLGILFFNQANAQWIDKGYIPLSDFGASQATFIEFFDDNNGIVGAAGFNPQGFFESRLLKTTNGGTTWTSIVLPGSFSAGSVTFRPDNFNNFFVGRGDWSGSDPAAYKTDNGGETLTVIPQIWGPGKFYFRDSQVGFYYSMEYFVPNLHKTTNGGTTWTSVSPSPTGPQMLFVNFPDALSSTGYAYSLYGNRYVSNNNGTTWTESGQALVMVQPDLSTMNFINLNLGYVSTAIGILKTTNGGVTWQTISSIKAYKLKFINANEGFMIKRTDSGEISHDHYDCILKTTDGGITWTPTSGIQPLTDGGMIDIFFGNSGYALTTSGRLYKYEPSLATNMHNVAPMAIINPVGEMILFGTEAYSGLKYSIIDISGRIVGNGTIIGNSAGLPDISQGIYTIAIEGYKNAKFIKR